MQREHRQIFVAAKCFHASLTPTEANQLDDFVKDKFPRLRTIKDEVHIQELVVSSGGDTARLKELQAEYRKLEDAIREALKSWYAGLCAADEKDSIANEVSGWVDSLKKK